MNNAHKLPKKSTSEIRKAISKIPQLAGMLLLALCISLTAYPSPMSFKKTFELASSNFRAQNYDAALPILLELREKALDNANISYMIGVCYLNKKREEFKAIPYLEAAVKNSSADHNPWSSKEQKAPELSLFHLANAYQIAGRYMEAISCYLDASMTCVKGKKGIANRKLYNDIHSNIDECKRQLKQIAGPQPYETSDSVLYW